MKINKKLRKIWLRYKSSRQLHIFYRNQFGSPGGAKYIVAALLFFIGSFYVFRQAKSFIQVLPQLGLILAVLLVSLHIMATWEIAQLRKLCRERLAENEFKKRLDKATTTEVVQYLGEKVVNSYGITSLKVIKHALQGIYQGEKLAMYYFHLEQDEVLPTQTMVGLLRECKQKGITQVRVFVNTEFNPKAKGLGERFEIQLRTYNGPQLRIFLGDSPLHPSSYEIDALIKRESEKQLRRLAILRKEAVRGNKFITYLIYSGVLLSMAWFKIGYPFWNLGFGLIMLGLALLSLRQAWPRKEEIIF